ncbi:MAG: hypothetical protein ACK4K9_08520 [Bacteroidia bacterium]
MLLRTIQFKTAGKVIIIISIITIVYHLLIITGIVPYKMVWGGRLESREEMLKFESISIALNLLLMAIVIYRLKLSSKFFNQLLNVMLWAFTGLFILNTLGNVLSNSVIEAIIFTPVTLLIALLCLRLTLEKQNIKP